MHLSSSIFTNVSKHCSQETVLAIVKNRSQAETPMPAQTGKTNYYQQIWIA